MDPLVSTIGTHCGLSSLRGVIDDLVAENLRVVVSIKEGCFVAMPHQMFAHKASEALDKNFVPVSEKR